MAKGRCRPAQREYRERDDDQYECALQRAFDCDAEQRGHRSIGESFGDRHHLERSGRLRAFSMSPASRRSSASVRSDPERSISVAIACSVEPLKNVRTTWLMTDSRA